MSGDAGSTEKWQSPTVEEKAARKAKREVDAAIAMAEHEERERAKYANLERLRAERLRNEKV